MHHFLAASSRRPPLAVLVLGMAMAMAAPLLTGAAEILGYYSAPELSSSPQARIGRYFWVSPRDRPFTPSFYRGTKGDERVDIDDKTRFQVVGVVAVGRLSSDKEPWYRLRLQDGREAYMPADEFESELYVDPVEPTQIDLAAAGYLSPQAYLFDHKSIFAEDPDLLGARLRNQGPTRLRQPDQEHRKRHKSPEREGARALDPDRTKAAPAAP